MKKLFLAALVLFQIAAVAKTIEGKVIEVLDGDTIKIQADNQINKVRLAYIDAPELNQKFGNVSRNSLVSLALNKKANAVCNQDDMYGRDVCVVTVENTVLNEAQLTRGLAWAYTYYLPKHSKYPSLEAVARKNKLRIWSDSNPVAPWDFRKVAK